MKKIIISVIAVLFFTFHGFMRNPAIDNTYSMQLDKDESLIEVQKPHKVPSHSIWDALLQAHVTDEGRVDYKGFKRDSEKFNSYLKLLSENMPQATWSKAEKLAYWINAYNAFTVKLIINNYPLKSIKEISKPWDLRFFTLGKKRYNLNEIEHEILRKMEEPRIHFGINCASVSCPTLLNRAFVASKLEDQLNLMTITFLADGSKNKLTEELVELSRVFKWFSKDFKQEGSLIDFLNKYSNIKISPKAKIRYQEYNWSLNE